MNLYKDFIDESRHIIKAGPGAGQFYAAYVDITDFYTINLFYGEESGDAILGEMGKRLEAFPGVLLCRRIYADLFLCLCRIEDDAMVSDLLERYDKGLQGFLARQRRLYPACRIKLACGVSKIESGNLPQAIEEANAARKESKKRFTPNIVLYSDAMRQQAVIRHKNEREIYDAMRVNQFCFYLQPKVDLQSGAVIGAEALARRVGEDGRVIYPDTFMDLMEKNGAVVELDLLICRQVCSFLEDRLRKGLPVFCISVNVSRLHIQNPDTADELHAMAAEHHIPPELLEFELTETILLEEFAGAKQLTDQLRAYGYRVSIDDFGSGYTGINVWQELNFDCLKLDRKFLEESPGLKQRNAAIVPNIINIAQRLHVQVVCEGVETEEQCRYLMEFGCTLVQGFFFSQPLPPEELFRIYEQQGGRYPLPPSLNTAGAERGAGRGADHTGQPPVHARQYMVVIVLCALFLGVCIAGVLTVNRNEAHREFAGIVTETLNAYTNGQRENTLKEMDGVTSTLQSLAVLIKENDDPEFISAYLRALNEESPEVKYMYYSSGEYRSLRAHGYAREQDIETMERMRQGETVVTNITRSERLGDIYCVGIGVPVMKDGEFMGAVRGIIDASSLVSTELYDTVQGEISAVFLTDGDSVVLPIQNESGSGAGDRLMDLLREYGIEDNVLEELEAAFGQTDSRARSIRIGTFGKSPYYLSITGLKYNGWHLVVCLKADRALEYYQHIVHNTSWSITGLCAAVFLVSAIMVMFGWKMQRRFSLDEQRYLLLERFSDTVLFDYDRRNDTIRFTSNVSKFLRVHDLVQKDFLQNLNQVYVYAADQEEVREMLGGADKDGAGEIRVRLMRPEKDEVFWCLVQYQYLCEKGTVRSVIGKITDIDEHMRHENYLLRMSETDGLTGLLNKTAAEKAVDSRLVKVEKGMLFIIDVDGFKQVNDRYGHGTGDEVLRFLGEGMRRTFHERDVLGRIGGDEMLAFSEDIHRWEDARDRALALLDCLETCVEKGIPKFSVSIGTARFPGDGRSYRELYRAADQAMYSAKRNGKGQFCYYGEIRFPDGVAGRKETEGIRPVQEETEELRNGRE